MTTPPKRIAYVAGPMSGLPLYNFPAFDAARDKLLAEGWEVISPADMDRAYGFDPIKDPGRIVTKEFVTEARRRDIDALDGCHAIYMLEGSENSVGALAELAYARWCGCEVMYQCATQGESAIKRMSDAEAAFARSVPTEANPVDMASEETRNPKDIAGSKKCPMHLLPPVAMEKIAWVHGIGAAKYLPFNWRDKKISASQYVAAIMRHLMAWHGGQDDDSESGITHLAHIGATVNILMDAGDNGCLIDDRPVKRTD